MTIKAAAIYPGTTEYFPLQWVCPDEDYDVPAAYGIRPDGDLTERCPNCGEYCDILLEDGAQGAPKEGIPACSICLPEYGGEILETPEVEFVSVDD